MKTLAIVNPNAASGRTLKVWQGVEPILRHRFTDLEMIATQKPADVPQAVEYAYENDFECILAVGGDGTNNSVVNALGHHIEQHTEQRRLTFGTMPVGTGSDWAAGIGMPKKPILAAQWLCTATPKSTDIGKVANRYFLNISSIGLGGEVGRKLEGMQTRQPWSYFTATIASFFTFQPVEVDIVIDDTTWYAGDIHLLVIANGTTFGHGMKIAPEAINNDGYFDVLLGPKMGKHELLMLLARVYSGSHLTYPKVKVTRTKKIRVRGGHNSAFSYELDGEYAEATSVVYEVLPNQLDILR